MKNLIPAFLILLLVSLISCLPYQYTFKTDGTPTVGDNVIILKNVSAAELKKHLAISGYTFEPDDDEMILRTNEKPVPGSSMSVRMNIVTIDSNLHIRPEFTAPQFSATISGNYDVSWMAWEYKNASSDLNMFAFDHFFPTLAEFSNSIVFTRK